MVTKHRADLIGDILEGAKLVQCLKINMIDHINEKEADSQTEQTSGYQWGKGRQDGAI